MTNVNAQIGSHDLDDLMDNAREHSATTLHELSLSGEQVVCMPFRETSATWPMLVRFIA